MEASNKTVVCKNPRTLLLREVQMGLEAVWEWSVVFMGGEQPWRLLLVWEEVIWALGVGFGFGHLCLAPVWRMKFQGKNCKAVAFSFQQICLWEDKATSEPAFPCVTGWVDWLRQSHLGSDAACLVFWLPLLQRTWRAQTLFRVWLSELSAHNNHCKEDRVYTARFPFNQS